jgi:hypothetical protein
LLDARDTGVICERTDNRTKSDRPITAADFAICPDCGGTMRPIATVPRACNPQPFSAFKCWTGKTPSQMRAAGAY